MTRVLPLPFRHVMLPDAAHGAQRYAPISLCGRKAVTPCQVEARAASSSVSGGTTGGVDVVLKLRLPEAVAVPEPAPPEEEDGDSDSEMSFS